MKTEYKFDVAAETQHIIDWIKKYFAENGPGCNAIVGISGGKDSSIVAALCARALGPERVIGILMPQNEQIDIEYSHELVSILGIKSYTFNIGKIVDATYDVLGVDGSIKDAVTTNTPARIRMSLLYAFAAHNHGRVANTCNCSEDYVGYSTKYGDNAGDFAPLQDYTVTEVIKIGEFLDLPVHLIYKAPSDGMCGLSDEENLGFTYEQLDNMLRYKILPPANIYENIISRHKRNKHKIMAINLPHPNALNSTFIF